MTPRGEAGVVGGLDIGFMCMARGQTRPFDRGFPLSGEGGG